MHLTKAEQGALDRLRARGQWTTGMTLGTSRPVLKNLERMGLIKKRVLTDVAGTYDPIQSAVYIAKEHYDDHS
jgi:hypothetical protein